MTERDIFTEGLPPMAESIAASLYANGCIIFEDRKIKLHETYPDCPLSPVYIDLRRLSLFPALLDTVAALYAEVAAHNAEPFDACVGVPDAGTPLATAFALETGTPQIVIRKQAKIGHGIEGIFLTPVDSCHHHRVLVLDDLATTGGSKIEIINLLKSAGFYVSDVVVLLERGKSATHELAQIGVALHFAFNLDQLLHYYQTTGILTLEQLVHVKTRLAAIEEYLKAQQAL